MIFGVLLSVAVSVLFAAYAVPRKFSRQDPMLYAMWAGAAYFVGSMAICSVVWGFGLRGQEDLFSPWHLLTALRGLVWTCGMAFFNLSIDKIGLTRFNQWKNLQGPIGTLLMQAFLYEVVGAKGVWLFLGMTAMFASAALFTIKPDDASKNSNEAQASGVLFAIIAAACFGVTAFINKIVTDQGFIYSQLLYHSMSVVISAAAIFIVKTRRPKEVFHVSRGNWLPAMSGTMFLVATAMSIFSYTMIAGSVAWSITQLNAVWTILIGIFVFGEVSFKKHRPRIITGFAFALAAIALLLFAL